MRGVRLIPTPAVEEGAKLANHGVNRASRQADRAATILMTRLTQKGTAPLVHLSATTAIAEVEKLPHIFRTGAVGRRSCSKRRRERAVGQKKGAEIFSQPRLLHFILRVLDLQQESVPMRKISGQLKGKGKKVKKTQKGERRRKERKETPKRRQKLEDATRTITSHVCYSPCRRNFKRSIAHHGKSLIKHNLHETKRIGMLGRPKREAENRLGAKGRDYHRDVTHVTLKP